MGGGIDQRILDIQNALNIQHAGSITNKNIEKDGIYVCSGGANITLNEYNQKFRGWGFTFF